MRKYMELYKVPNHSYVKLMDTEEMFKFFHIDGMYSYCKDMQGNIVHLRAWTAVDIVDKPIDNVDNM